MPLTKLDGEHGIVSVGADEGRIVIRVSEDRVGREVKSRYHGAYKAQPIAAGDVRDDAAVVDHLALDVGTDEPGQGQAGLMGHLAPGPP